MCAVHAYRQLYVYVYTESLALTALQLLLCHLPIYLFAQSHTDKLNTQVALHQLYQYASKYYDGVSFTQVLI